MIETPHRLQSIRNQRKLLYKALGAEIARKITRSKEQKKGFLEQGPGVVYIARRFDAVDKYLDETGRKVKGHAPHTTFTAHNKELTVEMLNSIMANMQMPASDREPRTLEALAVLINKLVVACGYGGEITVMTNEDVAIRSDMLVDLFVAEHPRQDGSRKAKPLKIKFIGKEIVAKKIKLGKLDYTLIIGQDNSNKHMYLLRLVPLKRSDNVEVKLGKDSEQVFVQHLVYESLVIANSRRKMEVSLVDKVWVQKVQKGDGESNYEGFAAFKDKIMGFKRVNGSGVSYSIAGLIDTRKEIRVNHTDVSNEQLKLMVEEETAKILDSGAASTTRPKFHPTYAYLRLQFPATRFLPPVTSPLAQTKDNIPFLSTLLNDIAKLHWTYAGLRAVAAALVIENKIPFPVYSNPKVKHWTNIDTINQLLDEYVFVTIYRDTPFEDISRKTPEQMIEYIATMADVVTVLYMSNTNKDAVLAEKQLQQLYSPDPYLTSSFGPAEEYYGHRIAMKLLADAPVKMALDTGAFEIPDKSKPISMSIKRVGPWTSYTESSEVWNLGMLFSVYRFKMLNLMEWMGTGLGKEEKPAWATTYKTQDVIPTWKPDYAKNKNVDYTCLIPVRLNVQQQLKIHVHTFVSNIYGTEVRSDKRFNKTLEAKPAAASQAVEAGA